MRSARFRAIVFDKDGTLVDFHKTWDPVFDGLLRRLAGDDIEVLQRVAAAIDFDLATATLSPDSPVIAESNAEFVVRIAAGLGRESDDAAMLADMQQVMGDLATSSVTEVVGASAVLNELTALGVPLGMATNDSEAGARRQIEQLGWTAHFQTVLGYDSGHGAKPGPGMVTASAERVGVPVAELAMVGDSFQDLASARAAGAIAVLFGDRTHLADQADVVIGSLAELLQ